MKVQSYSTLVIPLLTSSVGAVSGNSRFLQNATESNCTSITEILCDNGGEYPTESICLLLEATGIQDELDDEVWTIFAPTDEAFDDVPSEVEDELAIQGETGLIDLLAFHMVEGSVLDSTDLKCDDRVLMANEMESVTVCEGALVYQVGIGNLDTPNYPEIEVENIEACNGIIHLVSKVMLHENFDVLSNSTENTEKTPILTLSPTESPSTTPTTPPTISPSEGPSKGPSKSPSTMPSDSPTQEPSELPSIGPTHKPSDSPSNDQSQEPSESPSLSPTQEPTELPSGGPAREPSELPSSGPTQEPTKLLSDDPTQEPTKLLSNDPTQEPSPAPTDGPSPEPSSRRTSNDEMEEPLGTITFPSPISSENTTEASGGCSMADIICDSEELTYLCAALDKSGLTEVFDDESRIFTLFAPSDSAFENLGSATIDYLMDNVNVNLLTEILAFHAKEGKTYFSNDLECSERIEMANGKDSRTVCRGAKIYQKGMGNSDEMRPEIIETDIETCTGIMHIVSEVMLHKSPDQLGIPSNDETPAPTALPTTFASGTATSTATYLEQSTDTSTKDSSSCKTIDQVVCDNPDFSILCDNLDVSGIADALATGTWTLFAPNNLAFLKLPPDYVKTLFTDEDILTRLLLFHALEGHALYKDDLPCIAGQNLLTMANGKDSRTLCKDITPGVPVPKYQKGQFNSREQPPEFLSFDMKACNGVVHELDSVMLFQPIH